MRILNCVQKYALVAIHMAMSGNIYDKSYQLKLNNINCHVYRHIGLSASFDAQFDVLSIILLVFILLT